MRLHVFRAAMLLIAAAGSLRAQADTARRPFFTWRDAAILEAFAIATVAAAPLDRSFAERLQNPNVQENKALENLAVFVEQVTDPGAYIIGISLYGYGRLRGRQRIADLGLHGTEALFIGQQMGYLLKGIFGRARPYVNTEDPHNYSAFRGFTSGDYRAFPSGHSIAAFSAAATVTSEAKRWWRGSEWYVGPVMYGGAAAVAWSRMFDNKHWSTDVLTGAAIGTFIGLKVVHYHHYWNVDNRLDERLLGLKVSPAADGRTLVGLNVTY